MGWGKKTHTPKKKPLTHVLPVLFQIIHSLSLRTFGNDEEGPGICQGVRKKRSIILDHPPLETLGTPFPPKRRSDSDLGSHSGTSEEGTR